MKINPGRVSRIFLSPYHYAGLPPFCGHTGAGAMSSVENYFERHFGRRVTVTPNGRTAIAVILRSLGLKPDDEVYITTTFEKPNVSSCVTCTIFNFCRPSRVITDKTKAIFAIHEFGVPHPRISGLRGMAKERRIPLIEDCAHTIDSVDKGGQVGVNGDYVVCSFPKIFPVRQGGLMMGDGLTYKPTAKEKAVIDEVKRTLPRYLSYLKQYSERKRANFALLESMFKEMRLEPLYTLAEGISPAILFPLVTDGFEGVMEALSDRGIECGLWHGANIVVLPGHQFLTEREIRVIFKAVERGLRKGRCRSAGRA